MTVYSNQNFHGWRKHGRRKHRNNCKAALLWTLPDHKRSGSMIYSSKYYLSLHVSILLCICSVSYIYTSVSLKCCMGPFYNSDSFNPWWNTPTSFIPKYRLNRRIKCSKHYTCLSASVSPMGYEWYAFSQVGILCCYLPSIAYLTSLQFSPCANSSAKHPHHLPSTAGLHYNLPSALSLSPLPLRTVPITANKDELVTSQHRPDTGH